MVGIVIATHGEFAPGIKQSIGMVFGEQPNMAACSLMPSMGPDDIRAKIEEAIASFDDQDQVLILADLWGGTPFNQSNMVLEGHEDTWAIVTGLNLPMLVEACTMRFDASKTAHDIAAGIVKAAREGVRVKPESLEPAEEKPAAVAPAAPAGAIPPGTVLGDGHIKFAGVRIDTRLLHGQVATSWTKTLQPNRIIVVSDGVAHDELRKTMIEQAAPPGVPANVVPIKKMIEVSKDTRFGTTKALLLFENPQDLLACIEGGVDIKDVNIGSMAHSVGKVVVSNAIAMGEDDIESLEKLISLGVRFEARKVPSDASGNVEAMIEKAKSELASAQA